MEACSLQTLNEDSLNDLSSDSDDENADKTSFVKKYKCLQKISEYSKICSLCKYRKLCANHSKGTLKSNSYEKLSRTQNVIRMLKINFRERFFSLKYLHYRNKQSEIGQRLKNNQVVSRFTSNSLIENSEDENLTNFKRYLSVVFKAEKPVLLENKPSDLFQRKWAVYRQCYEMLVVKEYLKTQPDTKRNSKMPDEKLTLLEKLNSSFYCETSVNETLNEITPFVTTLNLQTISNDSDLINNENSRTSARLKKRKHFGFEKLFSDDYFVEIPYKRKIPATKCLEKPRQNYLKSDLWKFYEEVQNTEKNKWYSCIKTIQIYEGANDPKSASIKTDFFDFDNFRVKSSNETFHEIYSSCCCYCGLDFEDICMDERTIHVRRHLYSWKINYD